MSDIISSVIYTARQDKRATVVRLLSRSARTMATANPMDAEMKLEVAVNIAGMVMAVSTA
jgi:hypothetical protein